jgi:hypothetical protein
MVCKMTKKTLQFKLLAAPYLPSERPRRVRKVPFECTFGDCFSHFDENGGKHGRVFTSIATLRKHVLTVHTQKPNSRPTYGTQKSLGITGVIET